MVASKLYLGALDHTHDLLSGEIALMRSAHPIALLLQEEVMRAFARKKFHVHLPVARDIGLCGGHLIREWFTLLRQDLIQPVRDDPGIAGTHLARRYINRRLAF